MLNKQNGETSHPLVSIITPCFNHGDFISEAASSVINQGYENWEMIIVDDGSADGKTPDLIDDIKHQKISIFHTKNQGLPKARNFAISKSKGELILPLDADDLIEPSYLQKTVPVLLNKNEIGIVASYTQVFGAENWISEHYFDLSEFLFEPQITATSLFRRSDFDKVGGYDPGMMGLEDFDLWIKLLNLGLGVEIIKEPLFKYRKHKANKFRSEYSMRAVDEERELNAKLRVAKNSPQIYQNNIELMIRKYQYQKSKIIELEKRRTLGNYLYKIYSKIFN